MSASKGKYEDAVCLSEEKDTMRQESVSGKGRIRKSKKPEIQIYRPGALRHKRSGQLGDQTVHVTRGQSVGKLLDTKEHARDDIHRHENMKRIPMKGRQEPSQENKINKEHSNGGKTRYRETDKQSVRKGGDSGSEANDDSSIEKIRGDNPSQEEPQACMYLSKEKENSGYVALKEQQKLVGKDLKPKERHAANEIISDKENVRNNSQKDDRNTYEKLKNQEEKRSSIDKSVSSFLNVPVPKRENLTSTDSSDTKSSEKEANFISLKENYNKVILERNINKKNDKHISGKHPLKKDGKGLSGKSTNVKGEPSLCIESVTKTNQPEVSDSILGKKNFYSYHERSKGNRSGKDCTDWTKKNDETKVTEKDFHRRTTEKSEKHVCDRTPVRRNEMSRPDKSTGKSDKTRFNDKISFKERENKGETGVIKQHKKDAARSHDSTSKSDKSYKGNYDYHQKKETCKGSQTSSVKSESFEKESSIENEISGHCSKAYANLDFEHYRGSESHKKKEENIMTVSELAAKVDELATGKLSGKVVTSKRKGKGWLDNVSDEKQYFQDLSKCAPMEDQYMKNISLPVNEIKAENRTDLKNAAPLATPEYGEKSSRAKSYSSARENRRNRGGNKLFNQGTSQGNQREELKVEVTVGKNNHERTAHIRHISESDTDELENKPQTGQERLSGRNTSEGSSFSQKQVSSIKMKSGGYSKTAGFFYESEDKCSPVEYYNEDEGMDSMIFIDIPEDDWGEEVDRAMTWCNQHEGGVRAPTWADEKLSWRGKKEKHHPESEDPLRRVESPCRRGGLIQLSTTVSGSDITCSEPAVSYQMTNSAPLLQKHLYNPSNPSRPVPVVPSARDLPASRDSQREGSRGLGDNPSSSFLMQSSHANEYALEGHSPKIDLSILYNVQKGEMDINYYVSSNQLPVEFRRIMDIRHHLQGCYKQLLVSDIRMCQEKNVEGSLWKTLYYVIIEKLREYISRDPSLKDRSLSTLLMLVDEGQRYLQDLLEALQQEYGFTLEDHLEEEGTSHTEIRGKVRMALMSAQKLLLSLGDLARYREQYSSAPNFTLAKKWYQMALQVHPRNGRPFNQLAIIAVNQKRPLDVVYYYVRSLTASNPFMSARDSLVSMFDDIRKKYISIQHNEPNSESMQTTVGRAVNSEGLRQEIWIRPDSGATNCRTLSHSNNDESTSKEDELKKLSLEQIMKRFLTSYLHCHGMLFSRVGLDGFRECCVSMLQEFSLLLRASPPRLSTNHLLQIMTINMYAVSNTELKDARVGSGYRSVAQELALVLAQEMFGRVVQVVVELLPRHLQHHLQHQHQQEEPPAAVDPQRLFTPTLAHFMPALKAWCDWLLYHSAAWNPPPAASEYCVTRGGEDTWSSVAELATIVRGLGSPDVALTEAAAPDLVPLRLTEDAFLRGYEPLLPAHATLTYYTSPLVHTGRACDWARVLRLQTCLCQFLCGVEPPVLRLQKTDLGHILVSVVATSPPHSPTTATSTTTLSLSTSDVEVEDSLSESDASEVEEELEMEPEEEDLPLASTVRLLTHRKKVLERKQRQQHKLQSLLEGSVTLEMEVRPRYLVPDTNCFIEHLEVVQALVNSAPYTVMVPLVVLNELDGLSRDAAVAKYGSLGHAVRVREGAAAALHYLRDSKPHSLKCVTSQGSVLSSTTFTAEIDMPDATNDDKILSCCVHFCSDSTQRRPIKAGVRRLYREVVLLTEDRNLRVKAHARDIPVRDLLDFARWAGVR